MKEEYSVSICRDLEAKAGQYSLHRPMRIERYEKGTKLKYRIKSVGGRGRGNVSLVIDKFIGSGFAGQLYRVKIIDIDAKEGIISGIEKDA
ncbi:MAG: hypothetical protein JRI91_09115, partial [Deltaproteobacteria bacterium]|nr:hypothetical protein [Deltaproteobacteria bacterium]